MIPEFSWLPPEINSALIFGGAGSGPLLSAASAWEGLAQDLQASAASFHSVIVGLTAGPWTGPASDSMAAVATPYVGWLNAAAGHAAAAAGQARVAATAFETALTAMVHPAVVTANRASLPKLVAMNFLGQNTTAIAANEFDYMQMWAQDVAAMVGYHSGATSVAATLAPFEGLGAHLAGLTSSLSSVVQRAEAAVPAMLSTLKALPLQEISMLMYPASMAMSPLMSMMSTAARGSTAGLAGTAATAARLPASIPKLAGGALSGVKALGAGRLGSAMSAGLGKARLVGAMSVPSTWQGSTPAGMASSAMRGMGAMHSAADLPAGAAAGRMTPMPMPMGMGGAGAGMAGMGRGGASPQVLPKRPCVVPRAGV